MRFDLWLDAEQPALAVFAVLPGSGADCFSNVALTPDDMRAVGVAPEIVAALVAGHEAGNWSR